MLIYLCLSAISLAQHPNLIGVPGDLFMRRFQVKRQPAQRRMINKADERFQPDRPRPDRRVPVEMRIKRLHTVV